MITGVGTDVVDINRFRSLDQRSEFIKRVFTPFEIENAPDRSSQDTFFATLFVIKEALLKALGCGLGEGSFWREIQIAPDWKPELSGFLGSLAREQSVSNIYVTHLHTDNSAVAFVILESTKKEEIHEQHRLL